MITAGDDGVCIVDEVRDRSDVGSDHVAVLTARHRLAVIRQFVLYVVHKIIEAPFVQSAKIRAVANFKIVVPQVFDLPSVRRLS